MPDFIQQTLDFFRAGFAEVNAVQGIIVAVVAAFMMNAWSRILVVTAGAVIAHVAIDIMAPVFAQSGAFRLPPVLEGGYWRYLALLFVGYLVAVAVLYAVKRALLRR